MGHSWIMLLALPMMILGGFVLDSWFSSDPDLADAEPALVPVRAHAGRVSA